MAKVPNIENGLETLIPRTNLANFFPRAIDRAVINANNFIIISRKARHDGSYSLIKFFNIAGFVIAGRDNTNLFRHCSCLYLDLQAFGEPAAIHDQVGSRDIRRCFGRQKEARPDNILGSSPTS